MITSIEPKTIALSGLQYLRLIALVLLGLYVSSSSAMAAQLLPAVSSEIRELTWEEEDGNKNSLASLRGKPVVLHFWAAWCTPCVEELPSMVQWKQSQQEAHIVLVSLDRKIAQAKYFISKHQLPMKARLASMRDLNRFEMRGLPATILLDAEGKESGRIVGAADWNDGIFTSLVAETLAGTTGR